MSYPSLPHTATFFQIDTTTPTFPSLSDPPSPETTPVHLPNPTVPSSKLTFTQLQQQAFDILNDEALAASIQQAEDDYFSTKLKQAEE